MYSLSGISFNLGERYEVSTFNNQRSLTLFKLQGQKFLGAGAYGYVVKALDKTKKELVTQFN